MKMLPPLNDEVKYTDVVFKDFFALVSVVDTAIKGLFYLSEDPDAFAEMVDYGISKVLEEIILSPQVYSDTKNKYAQKLYNKLTS